MARVNPKIYDKEYYLNICLGSAEFKKNKGKYIHPTWENYLKDLPINKDSKILDVGCGRGDIAIHLAKKAKLVIGIDYSKDGISIANKIREGLDKSIQKKTKFKIMDIKKIYFPNNYFDTVICIDVLEHLYKTEAEKAMQEISRVLKKNGTLFVHTGPNKILYDIVYKWYVLPLNRLLTKLDQIFKRRKYNPLPSDPRIPIEKIQHVNEPTYFYLKKLFKKHNFEGKLQVKIGYLKPVRSLRTHIYNAIIAMYPLSKIYPLNTLFGWAFIAELKKSK